MLGNWWFWTDFTYTVTLRLCIQLKSRGECCAFVVVAAILLQFLSGSSSLISRKCRGLLKLSGLVDLKDSVRRDDSVEF